MHCSSQIAAPRDDGLVDSCPQRQPTSQAKRSSKAKLKRNIAQVEMRAGLREDSFFGFIYNRFPQSAVRTTRSAPSLASPLPPRYIMSDPLSTIHNAKRISSRRCTIPFGTVLVENHGYKKSR
jgi:hypothetical protein